MTTAEYEQISEAIKQLDFTDNRYDHGVIDADEFRTKVILSCQKILDLLGASKKVEHESTTHHIGSGKTSSRK